MLNNIHSEFHEHSNNELIYYRRSTIYTHCIIVMQEEKLNIRDDTPVSSDSDPYDEVDRERRIYSVPRSVVCLLQVAAIILANNASIL